MEVTIATYLQELINQKKALANNLVEKGVQASEDEKFNTLVNKVLDISVGSNLDTSDATATSDDILLGKTAYVNEQKIVGNIETWDGSYEGDATIPSDEKDALIKQLIEGTIIEIVIPEGTTKLYHYSFYARNNLTKVIIPNSVKTIGREAFRFCSKLTNLIIPASVTEISYYALECGSSNNKATIRFEGTTPPQITSATFDTDYLQAIEVPMSAIDAYKTATNWANLADYIVGYEGD